MEYTLFFHCLYGNLDEIKNLAQSGTDFRTNYTFVIWLASQCGKLNIVQYLVGLGVNFHANNDYAVRCASEYGHLDIVQYLVNLGADFRAVDDYAICYASLRGHLNVVQYLVNLGADFRAQNDYAVYHAYKNGHTCVFQYLLSLGAYHPDIKVNFDTVNNLYSLGKFKFVHKLIYNNNCEINHENFDQHNNIKNSVLKIISSRQLYCGSMSNLHFSDLHFQFNSS